MRVKTLEIRWHDSKPIYACDFQRKHRSNNAGGTTAGGGSYKLATGGADKYVRIWLIHSGTVGQSPRVEYLSTLEKHQSTVNVVRWSPNGELLASAGDDGMIVIWTPTDRQPPSFGRDPEEVKYDKEFWRAKTTIRATTQEIYDLAWSPTSEYILSGSTDNTARIFNVADGVCVREIAEHNHYIQGVAWDPMNEYIATQSSDRSVHVYSISMKHGHVEVHAVGRNSRMTIRHARTPSSTTAGQGRSRPPSVSRSQQRHVRRSSISSETESAISETITPVFSNATGLFAPPGPSLPTPASISIPASASLGVDAPLTPATSVSGSSFAFLPPKTLSRRSSIGSMSAAGGIPPTESPRTRSTYGRSPSPMPPLPAIRAPPQPATWASLRLYGDENVTNFFRRLTFSPDGGLLMTPAGWFEDPAVTPSKLDGSNGGTGKEDDPPVVPKKKEGDKEKEKEGDKTSCIYVYSRAAFAKPPVAVLPGHKKASVAVRFSPILFELRHPNPGVPWEPKKIELDVGKGVEEVELSGFSSGGSVGERSSAPPPATPSVHTLPSPALSAVDHLPAPKAEGTVGTGPGGVFALPYRMMYAVATQDSVLVYDTQQTSPVCVMSKLHYDSFTDMSWSHDGQILIMASSDGYCSVAVFDEEMPLHPVQQHNLQLQSIALSHSHGLLSHTSSQHAVPNSPAIHPVYAPSPAVSVKDLPGPGPATSHNSSSVGSASKRSESVGANPLKRPAEPPTPAQSVDGEPGVNPEEPPKKRRRVELKHVGNDPNA